MGFVSAERNALDIKIGAPTLSRISFTKTRVGGAIEWDTLDNLFFPTNGSLGQLVYSSYGKQLGGDAKFSQIYFQTLNSYSFERHLFWARFVYGSTLSGEPGVHSKFFLGGLFNLSGLSKYEIFGDNIALGNIVYSYEIGKIKIIPSKPFNLYAGVSAEVGNAWGERNFTSSRSQILGLGGYLGMDTIFGPIYIGLGITDSGRKAAYFKLGPVFSLFERNRP